MFCNIGPDDSTSPSIFSNENTLGATIIGKPKQARIKNLNQKDLGPIRVKRQRRLLLWPHWYYRPAQFVKLLNHKINF